MARNRNTRLQIDSRQFPDWEEYEQEGLFTRIVAKLGFLFRKSATIDAPLASDGEDIPAIDAVNDRLLIQDATDDAVKLVAPEDLVSLVPSVTTDVEATPNVIPIRDANGTFKVGTPTNPKHPATMFYAVTGLLGASRVIYTAGTKTWTKPAGVTWAILGIIGGGGNGGRGDHTSAKNGGGGGGGSGARAVIAFDVTNEPSLTFVVGAAGAGSTVYGLTLNAGGTGKVSSDGGAGGSAGTVAGTLTKGTVLESVNGQVGEAGSRGGAKDSAVGGDGASAIAPGTTSANYHAYYGVIWPMLVPAAHRFTLSVPGVGGSGGVGSAGVYGGGGGGGAAVNTTEYAGGSGGTGFAVLVYG